MGVRLLGESACVKRERKVEREMVQREIDRVERKRGLGERFEWKKV